jgi:hypothetical protein
MGGTNMNKIDEYRLHARHCMDRAAHAEHAKDKRSWFLLAETWLDMIPEQQRTTTDLFDAAIRFRKADLNLRVVR